ncbi:hypothetical protein [Candidatus Contubernalis alkaliaceticus]|uniref:hypothetical protein n=1 Tax=Candidatus Contubernalis alkaliaceticus TaxID=338645 RepID=UPI001F4BDDBE|nr:hypothetical protein [Candidatus Contubernalis alkalaceticus]UNC92686.1 hypothetical protein HUE98_11635 [Candidatus Contubernalis alkalaceticus]
MRRFITVLIISCLLVLIIPTADYFLSEGNLFGLWTGMFGVFVGGTLTIVGLIFIIFASPFFFFKKHLAKNISLNGLSIIGIGVLTAISTLIFWLILGQPMLKL